MKINRQHLIKVLQAVRPGLASRELVENSTSFIFIKDGVLTYNDEVSVYHPIKGIPDDLGAVQAKEFFALLNKLTDEEIELVATDTLLKVNGAKTKAGIKREASCNTDEIDKALGTPKDWTALPATFMAAINFCLFSVGKDMTKPLLTCVHVGGENAISSDNSRLTWYDLGQGTDMATLNISAVAIKDLKSFNPTEYSITTGWVHFRTDDDVIFSCRIMSGAYPADKIMQIIEAATGDVIKLPEGLTGSLERAGIFTDGGKDAADNRIKVTVKEGQISVRGEGSVGWLEESSRARYKGDTFEFEVSPVALQQILSHTDEMILGKNLLKFEGEQFIHLVSVLASKKS